MPRAKFRLAVPRAAYKTRAVPRAKFRLAVPRAAYKTRAVPRAKALRRAVAAFRAGRWEDASAGLRACARDGLVEPVRFFLALAGPEQAGSCGPDAAAFSAARAEFIAAATLGEHARAERMADRLLALDRGACFRVARDVFLRGGVPGAARLRRRGRWPLLWRAAACWREYRELEALPLLDEASRAEGALWMRYFLAEIVMRRLDLFARARREFEALERGCPWLWEASCLRAELSLDPAGLSGRAVPESSAAAFAAWRGAIRLWSGDYAGAVADLDAADAAGNPDACCWRGAARAARGELDMALRDLDRRLALDPRDPEALAWRGEALRRAGRRGEARRDLDAAIALPGRALWALVNRALLNMEEGAPQRADADLARVIGVQGREPPPLPQRLSARRHPQALAALLEDALRDARGVRRSDPHLNLAWMRAAGVELPACPAPGAGLHYWLRRRGLAISDPEPATERIERLVASALSKS